MSIILKIGIYGVTDDTLSKCIISYVWIKYSFLSDFENSTIYLLGAGNKDESIYFVLILSTTKM